MKGSFFFHIIKIYKETILGIGDWGLGIGDWGLGPIPNPQSPIPNPQSPFFKKNYFFFKILNIINNILILLSKK